MKALIIGGTGATGKDLLNVLLEDEFYTEIVSFVRRKSTIKNSKLTEIITDFNNLATVSEFINGAIMFSCLGTTLKAAGSKENQRHIDFEIPSAFAEIAKKNGVSKIVLLSAYGASSSSRIFYSKIKGELEDKITELKFQSFIVLKPGFLLRDDTDRIEERITAVFLKLVNRLGILRKFKPLPTLILAKKMAKAPKILGNGKHTIELNKIFDF